MADEYGCKAELFAEMGDHAQDSVFPDRIQAGRGLIEKHYGRVYYEGSGQGDPFLHAAREF